MPYRIASDGVTIEHEVNGKWTKKQTARSHQAALRTLALLRGIEHGWEPTGAKTKS